MDEHLAFVTQKRLLRVKAALEKNNMQAHIVENSGEAVEKIKQLVPEGARVSSGGSVSLREAGVIALLGSGRYEYLDRDAKGIDREAVLRATFGVDAYFASANAVTENGEIYEMDGRGTRVAPVVFGPKQVVLVVGRNKIVEDVEAARRRNALVAAPANCHRLGLATPCAQTGICSNCSSPARICNAELVLRWQQEKDRMQVILVNEDLGY